MIKVFPSNCVSVMHYPQMPSEMDIVVDLVIAIRLHGLDVKCEVHAIGVASLNRVDIVIFNEDRTVRRMIEVKKHRSSSMVQTKGGKMRRRVGISKTRGQIRRYAQFGPVDLICGARAARMYIDQKMFLDTNTEMVRSFG